MRPPSDQAATVTVPISRVLGRPLRSGASMFGAQLAAHALFPALTSTGRPDRLHAFTAPALPRRWVPRCCAALVIAWAVLAVAVSLRCAAGKTSWASLKGLCPAGSFKSELLRMRPRAGDAMVCRRLRRSQQCSCSRSTQLAATQPAVAHAAAHAHLDVSNTLVVIVLAVLPADRWEVDQASSDLAAGQLESRWVLGTYVSHFPAAIRRAQVCCLDLSAPIVSSPCCATPRRALRRGIVFTTLIPYAAPSRSSWRAFALRYSPHGS